MSAAVLTGISIQMSNLAVICAISVNIVTLSGRYKIDWNYGMVAQYHARGEFGAAPISTVLNLQCD